MPTPPPDPDPSNVTGLIYRILTRWRVMLGALITILTITAIILLTYRLLGPLRLNIGPIGIEPTHPTTSAPLPGNG